MIMLDGSLSLRGLLSFMGIFNIQLAISYSDLKYDENI
jgi:hypothetical protein